MRALKPSRFINRPTRCAAQGLHHQSGMEAARCDELHLMQQGGLIKDLQAHPQPKYPLVVNGIEVAAYLPDFAYIDAETGLRVVEDVKGRPGDTEVYRLKRRLMAACHGIEVQEVRSVRGRR